MTATLSEPLARALEDLSVSDFEWGGSERCAPIVLAALRHDPETLKAVAEALEQQFPGRWSRHGTETVAAALLDVLLGVE